MDLNTRSAILISYVTEVKLLDLSEPLLHSSIKWGRYQLSHRLARNEASS